MKNNGLAKNLLICGDNLKVLYDFKKQGIKVDLIYLDPPFFSNRHYEVVWGDEAEIRSFKDRWAGGIHVYIDWMRERVIKMYDILKDTSSFYLHCDWHASHYLKVMLDEIFGYRNFRNEIIWCYKRWPSKQKNFQSMHDVILRYSKSANVVWNQLYDDFTEQTKKRIKGGKKIEHYEGESGKILIRATKEMSPGVAMCDYWNIPMIAGQAKERLGYPTQKPEALLERIIKASSNKGDTVLDPFCGCGTAMAVAHRLNRKWMGIDISPTAIKLIEKRLEKIGAIKDKDFDSIGMPTTISSLKKLEPFEFQNWVINEMQAKQSKRLAGDKGIDGYYDKSIFTESAGIQVKQSENVGRNVIDNFETALQRKKFNKGYIVGFSFTKDAHEEVARVKEERGLYIKLIKIEDLLLGKAKI